MLSATVHSIKGYWRRRRVRRQLSRELRDTELAMARRIVEQERSRGNEEVSPARVTAGNEATVSNGKVDDEVDLESPD